MSKREEYIAVAHVIGTYAYYTFYDMNGRYMNTTVYDMRDGKFIDQVNE